MKKFICLLLVCFLFAGLFAGCSGEGKEETDQGTTEETQKSEETQKEDIKPVELSFLSFETDAYTPAMWNEIVSRFEKDNPNIEIKREVYPNAKRGEYNMTLFATGQAPDVIFSGLEGIKYYDNHLTALPEELYSVLDESAITKIKGEVRVMPTGRLVQINMYYNKDIFDKYSLSEPKTWDEFVGICKTLKDNGEVPLIAGGPDKPWLSSAIFTNIMWSTMLFESQGTDWADKLRSGELKLNGPEITGIVDRWKALIDAEYFHEASKTLTYAQYNDEFAKGSAVIEANGSWAASIYETAKPSFKIGYFALPVVNSNNYYCAALSDDFGVPIDVKYKDEAFKFVKFAFTPEIHKMIISANNSMSTLKVPVTYEVSDLTMEIMKEIQGKNSVYQFAQIPNSPPGWGGLVNKVGRDIFFGADIKETLDNFEAKYRELLAEQE